MRSNFSFINVYSKNNTKSKVSTQILYGDNFKKINKLGKWLKIKIDEDDYKGYIKNRNFLNNQKNTHKILSLHSSLYLKPSSKYKTKKKLSFGSKIKVTKKYGNFFKFDKLWIKKKT